MLSPRRRRRIAVLQALVGGLLLFGVFGLLPARWLPIDALGALLGGIQLGSAVALVSGHPRGAGVARFAAWATLVAGALLASALAFTVAHLSGSYGPVGAGGALLMGTIAALILPYLVLLPALQLAWLRAPG